MARSSEASEEYQLFENENKESRKGAKTDENGIGKEIKDFSAILAAWREKEISNKPSERKR